MSQFQKYIVEQNDQQMFIYCRKKDVYAIIDQNIDFIQKLVPHNPTATWLLGTYYKGKRDYKKYVKYCKIASKAGNVMAMIDLGFCYIHAKGITKNEKKGVKWWKCAIKNDKIGLAHYNLAHCYWQGLGVFQDYDEAIKLFNIAIEKGYSHAENILHTMLNTKLFQSFANQNYLKLHMKLKQLELENAELKLRPSELGGTPSYKKAFKRFEKNKILHI